MVGIDGRVRVMDLGLARALGGEDDPAGTGRVSVMDPGLARALGREDDPAEIVSPDAPTAAAHNLEALAAQVTQAGAVMGTPAYMSPEQYKGQPADARADVFSFCVTLWEALMGERPFAGNTLMELAANVLSGTVRPVPRDPHAQRVPGWLRHLCLRGLAIEPEGRFDSMEALLAALSHESIIDSTPMRRARRLFLWSFGAVVVAVSVPAMLADAPPPMPQMIALPLIGLVVLALVTSMNYRHMVHNPRIWSFVFLIFIAAAQMLLARIAASGAGLTVYQYIPIEHAILLGFAAITAYRWIPRMWVGVGLFALSGSLAFIAPTLFWKVPVIVYPLVGLLIVVWWPEKLKLSHPSGARRTIPISDLPREQFVTTAAR